MLTETLAQLRPATVVSAEGRRFRLALDEVEVDAASALGYPYRAEPGDVVLTIAQDDACYVIGVLEGRGVTSFTAPGDLEFRAPRGRISFSSRERVDVDAPQVRVRAGRLEFLVGTLVEKCTSMWQWVRETFQLRAGLLRTTSDAEYVLRAERIEARAEGNVRIDGKRINLG